MSRHLLPAAAILFAALACSVAPACAKPVSAGDPGGSSGSGGSSGGSFGSGSGSNPGSGSGPGFASGLGTWDPNSPTRWGASSSGGAGSGSGSAAGSSTGGAAACTSSLIDNVNYMTNAIIQDCGRWGFWYAFNPGPASAMQFPAMGQTFVPSTPGDATDPGVNGYNGAARTYGTGFSGAAGGMGFDLVDLGSGMKGPYDATRFQYTGVKFYAKLGATTGAATAMTFRISDKYSDPSAGMCDKNATAGTPTQCYDDATYAVTLTTTWTLITVPFAMAKPVPFGYRAAQQHPPALDPTSIYQMQFSFQNPSAFDVWIDEVSFTP
jgi:hypothetical protein